jgi:hypothetical protein
VSDKIGQLIFDEHPYKVYEAKTTGEVSLQYVPIGDYRDKIVYKGTGSINLVCYEPFAHSRADTKHGVDGRHAGYYKCFTSEDIDYHLEQWVERDVLIPPYQKIIDGQNFGDMPAPFIAKLNGTVNKNTTITVANNTITVLENSNNVIWDSKNGIITGEVDGVRRAIDYKGKIIHTLPVLKSTPPNNYISTSGDNTKLSIEYQFWYY